MTPSKLHATYVKKKLPLRARAKVFHIIRPEPEDLGSLETFPQQMTLRRLIRGYEKWGEEIRRRLREAPNEWGKYQSFFNAEINRIFRLIMEYEKEHLLNGKRENVERLHKLFIKKIRRHFLHGRYIAWSLEKPHGYAGDFKIIDDIYLNRPGTLGFDRLYDNYFQMSAISVAVRNRKEDFKRLVKDFILSRPGRKISILDVGCGPCRDVFELACDGDIDWGRVTIDCLDNDPAALNYGKELLASAGQKLPCRFMRANAVRLALKKDIRGDFPQRYDLIYSTGLFDYFDDRVTRRLAANFKTLLKPEGGILAISDVRDKYSNPSVHFMEWVGEWSLIYREDENFRQLFLEAGFPADALSFQYEQQGIMQYILGRAS